MIPEAELKAAGVPTENPIIVDRFDKNMGIPLSLAGVESWVGEHEKGGIVYVCKEVRDLAIMVLEMYNFNVVR